ncbi:MAG: substrate-binding domain-containing protein, partial [Chitinophagaceae bacterium]|nr:substrate-binding domain-containing protein [Anaerolineae bacterium]
QVLNTQRSHTLEVIALDLFTGTPAIDTLSSTARALGYTMMVSVITAEDLAKTMNEAFGRSVDGFIFISSSANIASSDFTALVREVPFVRMIAEYGTDTPSVVFDQSYGTRLVVQHLIDLNHRQIAEISGPLDTLDASLRHDSLITVLAENGLSPAASACGYFSVESGYTACLDLLANEQTFTAIVAANDSMAIGALHALHEKGFSIPQDVSVVGFDDSTYAPYTYPPLTTVRQDFAVMARLATEYLVERIEKPDTPIYQQLLMPELIVRQSTRQIG